MSSPGFQSDAAAVAGAIQSFDESSADARKTMADLESDLTSALSNQYQGLQARAFWDLHQRLNDDMQAASRQLDTMRELVHNAHASYNRGDQNATDAFTQVTNQANAGGGVLNRLVL